MLHDEPKEFFVVDDEIINFKRMLNTLTKEDYKVLRASGYWSGISALRLYSGCLGLLVTALPLPPMARLRMSQGPSGARLKPESNLRLASQRSRRCRHRTRAHRQRSHTVAGTLSDEPFSPRGVPS